ncbi:Golgi transport complex subunit 1 [Gryganskiella cystojenkinii]|nr:Golgi transport complex subunit 1 [Gryganskiella cystojenkinii]
MTASDTRTTGLVDADDLFMRLSVPELNAYERRTRTDIENKKQELRMMVGERYRDLIGAADCIVRMKETAYSVQGNISKMRNSCDIHALKRSVATKTMKAQGGAQDDMKKSVYTSATQIKLLADAPEQIWRNMESNNFLTASRLYLLSKAIYRNLEAEVDDEDKLSVKEIFPVVGRQWDAVSHFKAQILQKSTRHLRSTRGSDIDVVETMCAIMLLDDVTIKDMFRLLLAQRQSAIKEALEVKDSNIGGQILLAIEVLKSTLFHVAGVFLEPESGRVSHFERYLRCLKQTFTSPSPAKPPSPSSTSHDEFSSSILQPSSLAPVNLATSVIPKLYPTTPNIHLLVRYLPESVQTFTPMIQLESPRAKFSQQEVFDGIRLWMEDIKAMFSGALEILLQQVQTSSEMVQIRTRVWAALQQDEYALTSKSTTSSWNEVCLLLLGTPVSLWNEVLRTGFSRAIQDIIVFSLEELSDQPKKVLRQRLGELDEEEDPNHDLGRFVWHDSAVIKGASLPSATEPLIQRIREYVAGKTDLVAQATRAFEEKLAAIRSDAERALVYNKETVFGRVQDADEDHHHHHHETLDLFAAKADVTNLTEFYQRQFVGCIKAYTHGLEQLVQESVHKPEKARLTIPAMDRAMTIGRIAFSVGAMSGSLQRAMVPHRDRSSNSNFAQSRALKANVEVRVQELLHGLQRVYLLSHEAWITSVEWSHTRTMKHYLQDSSWTDLSTLSWEPIPSPNPTATSSSMSPKSSSLSRENTSSRASLSEESKTLLPFHGSTLLITALHQVVQEMHRVGTGFMRPELVQILSAKLALVTFSILEQFLKQVVIAETAEENKKHAQLSGKPVVILSEKGAMQLLLDVKFLKLVFLSALEKDEDLGLKQLVQSVSNTIKGHIDPINLAVFDKPLDINADRQYSRVGVLLGLLVQLNPVESKRKVNVAEKSPHVFAMAPLTARFTLLPIGQKMTGRAL